MGLDGDAKCECQHSSKNYGYVCRGANIALTGSALSPKIRRALHDGLGEGAVPSSLLMQL
jgi:hypothetical protein